MSERNKMLSVCCNAPLKWNERSAYSPKLECVQCGFLIISEKDYYNVDKPEEKQKWEIVIYKRTGVMDSYGEHQILKQGYEPFAVDQGVIYFKRRVTEAGA